MMGSGGTSAPPPDCSGIETAGFALCESGDDFCAAIFEDSEGCSAVCAAAGLACASASDNVEGACEADAAGSDVGCESGHQSDYCVCRTPADGMGTGGAGDGAGGSVGSGGSGPMQDGPLFPAPGSAGLCPDPSVRFRFDAPPTLGGKGSLRVFDAALGATAVATIDLSVSEVTVQVGGATFKQPRPAYVHGNEAIFSIPKLSYGHDYYITFDEGIVIGPEGPVPAVTDPSVWTFSVAEAPPGQTANLRVALDGSGQFCSLQGAIDAAKPGTTVSVGAGAYFGLVYFKNKSELSIVGDDRESTLIFGINNNNLNPSTRGRALFGLEDVSQFSIEGVTIENQTPQGGSQAEALAMLSCDECTVRNATIKSLQDTLLWSGRIYAEDCLIEGNVDYIWGTGTAYFKECEIRTVGRKGYNVQARNESGNYGYVFVDSKLTADPGITGDVLARIDVSAYPASQVAYIDCEMGPHIAREGWTITGGGSTANLRFLEYKSRTPQGALVDVSGRAPGSRQISDAEAALLRDPKVVLDGWNPTP